MPTWAEDDVYLAFSEEMVGALDVVCALDLMIDVLDTGPVGRKQGYGVVDLVDPEQRRVADAVADRALHTRVQNCSSRLGSVVHSPTWLKPVMPASRRAK